MIKPKLNLDVGAGKSIHPGFVGMDRRPLPGIDIVHDVEVLPWPLDDGAVSVIIMSHLVEHIKPWNQIPLMDECWRILEPNGLLLISTPYGGSFRYNQDPTHCSPWNEATVEYYLKDCPLYQIYEPNPWKLEKRVWFAYGDLEIGLRKIDGDS